MKKARYAGFFRFLGLILFIYILSRIDIFELISVLKSVNPSYYLLGIACLLAGFLIRVLRWQILIQLEGGRISFKNLINISFRGAFLGIITPGKVGELWKAKYLVSAAGVPIGRAFYVTLVDKLLDILTLGIVSIFGIFVIYLKFTGFQNWIWPFLISVFLVVLFYFSTRKNRLLGSIKTLLNFFVPSAFKQKAGPFLEEFFIGLKSLNFKYFLVILILGFFYYLFSNVLLYHFTALSIGISLPFWYLFLVVAIATLIATLPITIFGIGTREAAFIYFLSLVSISSSSAVALAWLAFLGLLLSIALPGAIIFLKQR